MTDGRVLHAVHDNVHVLRYEGEVRYPLAPSVARFVDALLNDVHLEGLVIDLTKASMIDSTNLGQLARVATAMLSSRGEKVTLVSNQDDINALLTSMGLDDLFNLVEESTNGSPSEKIAIEPPSEQSLARIMLAAHRALVELSSANRDRFQDVVTLLEQQSAMYEEAAERPQSSK